MKLSAKMGHPELWRSRLMRGGVRPRAVGVSLGLVVGTCVAGSVVRFAPLGLPSGVAKYGGSALWALMIYWIVSTLLGRWRISTVMLVTAVLTAAVEFLKLYHSPALDAFRLTLPGVLLLGRFFSLADILAYWAAIGVGGVVDRKLRVNNR